MSDTAAGISEKAALTREPITIEEQADGFYSVVASTLDRQFITNDVGRFVIELCDGLRTGEQIVSTVGDRYAGMPTERVRKDVIRFLAAATSMGLVTWAG